MEIENITFPSSSWVPNNQRLPVLIYRNALKDGTSPSRFEEIFSENRWTGIWTNGVFDYQHYHSGAHEVLGVGNGGATLLIGGPYGNALKVSAGDCLILPAGTGHKNLGASPGFEVVGGYPEDQHADIQTKAATFEMLTRISSLPVPATDPIFGSSGGITELWSR
ncbi:cupin [Rhizobium ruizarguesonis]